MTRLQRIGWLFGVLCLLLGLAVPLAAQSEGDDTFQNPVISANFPDPFILEVDDVYYAYSTNSNSRNVPYATSTDLVNWQVGRDALPALPWWVNLNHAD